MSADLPAAPPTDLDALIERCVQGDQAAWETVVRQHWRKVFNVAYTFVGRRDLARPDEPLVVVVLLGDDLKEVVLEPPGARLRKAPPRDGTPARRKPRTEEPS